MTPPIPRTAGQPGRRSPACPDHAWPGCSCCAAVAVARDRLRDRRPAERPKAAVPEGGGRRPAEAEAPAQAPRAGGEQAPPGIHPGRADRPRRQLDRRADEPVRPLRDAAPLPVPRQGAGRPQLRLAGRRGGPPPAAERLHPARRPAGRLRARHLPLLLRLERVARGRGRGREVQGRLREVPRRLREDLPPRRRGLAAPVRARLADRLRADRRPATSPPARPRTPASSSTPTAVADVARKRDLAFVDLFAPTLALFTAEPGLQYTINGCHLNEAGDRAVGDPARQGPVRDARTRPTSASTDFETLRAAVNDKSWVHLQDYRMVNGWYVYGGRRTWDTETFPREFVKIRNMAAVRDRYVWDIARGKKVPPAPDDSKTGELFTPETRFGQVKYSESPEGPRILSPEEFIKTCTVPARVRGQAVRRREAVPGAGQAGAARVRRQGAALGGHHAHLPDVEAGRARSPRTSS